MEVYGSISRIWNVYLGLGFAYGTIWKHMKVYQGYGMYYRIYED